MVNEEELEVGIGGDKGVDSDEITAGAEVFLNSEGAVKVESIDNTVEESDPLNF